MRIRKKKKTMRYVESVELYDDNICAHALEAVWETFFVNSCSFVIMAFKDVQAMKS